MTVTNVDVTCRPMQSQSDADAFRTLNEEWISRWFKLEEKDHLTLGNPQSTILDGGGAVYVASDGDRIVGTAALIRYSDGIYELSKMAVAPETRGQGVGRKLLSYVLDQARSIGATTVFLGSSKRLESAVHLYESLGFRHVPPEELPAMKYQRADVFTKLDLRWSADSALHTATAHAG